MKKVFIVNKSPHDFSKARKYGELVYLSEGSVNRYNVNHMARRLNEALSKSSSDDYIVLCGLNVMNAVACAMFSAMHKKLNLLLYKRGDYVERNIVL